MKYLTLLLIIFTFMTCGNSKKASAMETSIEQISGAFYVNSIKENTYSSGQLTLHFNEKTNTVSGFSGCNHFNANYKQNGNSITIGPLATTRKMCQDSSNKMEEQMLSALKNVNSVAIKNHELRLSHSSHVLITAFKDLDGKINQEDTYVIEYTAATRGVYNHYIYENGKLAIQKDRDSAPVIKTFTQEDIKQLIKQVKDLDLEKINSLEAPSQRRFVDAATIASLEITYHGQTYKTPEFDGGEPNRYVAELVSTLLELAEKK